MADGKIVFSNVSVNNIELAFAYGCNFLLKDSLSGISDLEDIQTMLRKYYDEEDILSQLNNSIMNNFGDLCEYFILGPTDKLLLLGNGDLSYLQHISVNALAIINNKEDLNVLKTAFPHGKINVVDNKCLISFTYYDILGFLFSQTDLDEEHNAQLREFVYQLPYANILF